MQSLGVSVDGQISRPDFLCIKEDGFGRNFRLEQALMLADVSPEKQLEALSLEWVGMEDIRLMFQHPRGVSLPASLQAGVDLMSSDRGIHMSRLYQLTQKYFSSPWANWSPLSKLLNEMRESHGGLSQTSSLQLQYEYPRETRSLVTQLTSLRLDPLCIRGVLGPDGLSIVSRFEVLYSSTCPASAALSRQALAEEFARQAPQGPISDWQQWTSSWLEKSSVATPHAQRSLARVIIQHRPEAFLEAFREEAWIQAIEGILGTPVQEAVKRLDEQEFARRNARNLMFCEDAARRIGRFLKSHSEVLAFSCSVFHLESLHAHNAVARLSWGQLQYPPLENSPLK